MVDASLIYSRKPPRPRRPVIRATRMVRTAPIERSTRKIIFLRSSCAATSIVLEHSVGDDAAPPKGARASCLCHASIHKIGINGGVQDLSAHLPDLWIEGAELHVERRLTQLQQPDHFDNVRHACSGLRVADGALDGADQARFVTAFLDDRRYRADLDRIA